MNANYGRALWGLIDAFAVTYPDDPSKEEESRANDFFSGIWRMLRVAPGSCSCAEDWRDIIHKCPPPLRDGGALRAWVVAVHDWVNIKLGKPAFDAASPSHEVFHKLGIAKQCGQCGGNPHNR